MLTVSQIVSKLGGKILGNMEREVIYPRNITDTDAGCITFLDNNIYKKYLKGLEDVTIILRDEDRIPQLEEKNSLIVTDSPQLYYGRLLEMVSQADKPAPFISPQAYIHESVKLGDNVTIFPFVYIGENCTIGDNTVIYPNTTILANSQIGENTTILSNVKIYKNTKIGNNCYIDQGASMGNRGFGFPKDKKGHTREIPQIGNVIIGNYVYIGANTTIDRATVESTIIGNNTKIDNLVQIAHNIKIGDECLIISQSGIAGSTELEDNVIVAAQAGIVGHLKIEKGSIVGAQSGVTKNIPTGQMWSGSPARPHFDELRKEAIINKLPKLYKILMEVLHGKK